MLAEEFVSSKQEAWKRLTSLLDKARLGLGFLSAEELQELGRLYRQATSDLAVARRDYRQHRVTIYLNDLVGRAHGELYRSKGGRRGDFVRFFLHSFPQAFRDTWGYTLASFLMFLFPAIICFIVTWINPDNGVRISPELAPVIENIRSGHEWWRDVHGMGSSVMASFIMTNNIQVAFLAFAGGVMFGVLSLYVLAQNGIMLGVVAGAAQNLNFAGNLWGFIAAHGVIELSVIFIAGGAGLQIGWALFRPGLLTRRAAMVIATRRAFTLLLGCIPLLVIAGTIEGFISPSTSLPVWMKITIAILSGIALYSYLLLPITPPANALKFIPPGSAPAQ